MLMIFHPLCLGILGTQQNKIVIKNHINIPRLSEDLLFMFYCWVWFKGCPKWSAITLNNVDKFLNWMWNVNMFSMRSNQRRGIEWNEIVESGAKSFIQRIHSQGVKVQYTQSKCIFFLHRNVCFIENYRFFMEFVIDAIQICSWNYSTFMQLFQEFSQLFFLEIVASRKIYFCGGFSISIQTKIIWIISLPLVVESRFV